MSDSSKTLKLVLTNRWFNEIKSGRKTHEYRKKTLFYEKRLFVKEAGGSACLPAYVQFQRAYYKNTERMTFEILDINTVNGLQTDLRCSGEVYDIALGKRII